MLTTHLFQTFNYRVQSYHNKMYCIHKEPGSHLSTLLKQTIKIFLIHHENTPIQIYIENFTSKNWNFSDKNSNIFHISAQNNNCGYSLEPPRRGGSNEYPQSMFLSKNKKK